MSNRKLLVEIDRVLKKVDEGVAVFEQIWDKVYSASTTAQKEKYEADLKKEIKKLQRLRDQIKTWQGDSSVKDKSKLDQNRKLIEEKMEKFKVCEKETKTKAFSKEGLAQDRTDPKQKAKAEVGDWVRESISKLREQSDEFEAEIEQLSSGGKRKKRGEEPPRVSELKQCITRHEHHVEMLERVLRAIDNEQVTPKQCNDELKDSVEYYIEESQDGGDFDDEGMYDSLNLDAPSTAPVPSAATITSKKDKKDSDPSSAKAGVSQSISPSTAGVTLSAATNSAASVAAAASVSSNAAPPTGANDIVSPKGRGGRSGGGGDTFTSPQGRSGAANARGTGGVSTVLSPSRRGGGRDNAVSPNRSNQRSSQPQQMSSAGGRMASMSTAVKSQSFDAHQQHHLPQSDLVQQRVPAHQSSQQESRIPQSQTNRDSRQQQGQVPPNGKQEQDLRSGDDTAVRPDSSFLSDTEKKSDTPSRTSEGVPSDLLALEAASRMMPELPTQNPADSFRLFPSVPSFPTVAPSLFNDPALFEKFDPDTLFFIFYYRQGTYQQYLASRELKRQGWRYHTKYKAFFQRHKEPKVTTDEYETGTFVYFDYANVVYRGQGTGWCQRIKTDFCFEYRYLE